jgi:hypothetical protein
VLRTLTYPCVNPWVFGRFVASFFRALLPGPKVEVSDPPLAAPLGAALLVPKKKPLPGGDEAPDLGCDGDGERPLPNELEPPDVTVLNANPLGIAPSCPVGAAKGELSGYLGCCEVGAGAAGPTACG